jgi:hypothetical protein
VVDFIGGRTRIADCPGGEEFSRQIRLGPQHPMALSAPKVSSTVPVGVPLLAAPEEFSYQLFSLLGVSGCEKPPTTRLNLYWNLKYIDVRSFILTGAPATVGECMIVTNFPHSHMISAPT